MTKEYKNSVDSNGHIPNLDSRTPCSWIKEGSNYGPWGKNKDIWGLSDSETGVVQKKGSLRLQPIRESRKESL